MADLDHRTAICKRHGISPALAGDLHGTTPEQWEADAAARASIAQMLGAPPPEQEETAKAEADTPPPPDPVTLAAESREASDRQFIEALLRPKARHVEAIRDLHGLLGEEPS